MATNRKPHGTKRRAPAARGRTAPARRAPARSAAKARSGPRLLSGGNPQIAKADGDAPVQAYIAALTGWKRDLTRRVDKLVARTVPHARKAVKWNSPFYGIEGQGWFLSLHVFTRYLKVTFFRGTSLRPVPACTSKAKEMRFVDLHEGAPFDEKQLTSWIRQAAAIPGWGG